ncbi:glycosyltransferase, partial [Mycobacterium tuberculosis]|nr:glycosyltransferase [Mycobacterium tuberculosis]
LYVDALTPKTLAAAMERLVSSPEERLALARSAQAYVLATHTPERRAAELKAGRQTVIDRRRARQTAGIA